MSAAYECSVYNMRVKHLCCSTSHVAIVPSAEPVAIFGSGTSSTARQVMALRWRVKSFSEYAAWIRIAEPGI
jgi:hypothetical protein